MAAVRAGASEAQADVAGESSQGDVGEARGGRALQTDTGSLEAQAAW